ncbi:MAG: hypothetical protein ABMA01_18975 [Chthoniobacteraceae bacterium]
MLHIRFSLAILICRAAGPPGAEGIFDQSNLAAWCIVPFDVKKCGPEERAAMLEKMGVKKFAHDCRVEPVR